MKKKIILLSTALFLTVSAMFAQEVKTIPAFIVKALHKEFTNPGNVQWKTLDQLYKASFTVDGEQLDAFFSFDGTITAISRKLSIEQLPLALKKEAKEKSLNYGISDLFELLTDRGTEYFLVMNNEKETKKFRSEGYDWVRY